MIELTADSQSVTACDTLAVGGFCAQWLASESLAKYGAIYVCFACLID